jgi:hypothetical protein
VTVCPGIPYTFVFIYNPTPDTSCYFTAFVGLTSTMIYTSKGDNDFSDYYATLEFPGTTDGSTQVNVGVQRQALDIAAGSCDNEDVAPIGFRDFTLTINP